MNEEKVFETLINQDLLPAILFAYVVSPRVVEITHNNPEYAKLTNAKPVLGFRLSDDKLFPHDYNFNDNVSVVPYNSLQGNSLSIEDLELEPKDKSLVAIVGTYDKNTFVAPLNKNIGEVLKLSSGLTFFHKDLVEAIQYLKSEFLGHLHESGVVNGYDNQVKPAENNLVSKLFYKPLLKD
jgi:hypothetical protein